MVLDVTGKVQILSPTRKELGVYGCMVVNDFGSDMETSLLLYAGNVDHGICSIMSVISLFSTNTHSPVPNLD